MSELEPLDRSKPVKSTREEDSTICEGRLLGILGICAHAEINRQLLKTTLKGIAPLPSTCVFSEKSGCPQNRLSIKLRTPRREKRQFRGFCTDFVQFSLILGPCGGGVGKTKFCRQRVHGPLGFSDSPNRSSEHAGQLGKARPPQDRGPPHAIAQTKAQPKLGWHPFSSG